MCATAPRQPSISGVFGRVREPLVADLVERAVALHLLEGEVHALHEPPPGPDVEARTQEPLASRRPGTVRIS
jgi:hypothetical protein